MHFFRFLVYNVTRCGVVLHRKPIVNAVKEVGKAMENIIVAAITGTLTLIGVIVSNASSHRNFESTIKIAQAITDTKIDNLTQEVHKHNSFAERIPKIEAGLDDVERRISRLEE